MKNAVLAAFVLAALVHLAAILRGKARLRKITKACLVPLVLIFYCLDARRLLVTAILGAVFGWIGDVLLIRIGRERFFKLGLLSFLLGHLSYTVSIFFFVEALNVPALAVSLAAAIPLGIGVIKLIKPGRAMRIPIIVYSAVLELTIISALQLLLRRGDIPGMAILGGSLIFAVSDTTLGYFTFRTTPRIGNFCIMLTYLIAQSCILIGLARC
jgi:uncharacterized membrane protein YhhN